MFKGANKSQTKSHKAKPAKKSRVGIKKITKRSLTTKPLGKPLAPKQQQQPKQLTRAMSTAPKLYKYDQKEIDSALATVPKWNKVPGQRDAIQRKFTFQDFNQAFGFMTRTALHAEVMCHHPEWFNVYNRVEVVLSTHDVSGLSKNDFDLAIKMDKLADEFQAV